MEPEHRSQYLALDFETANEDRASVCAFGICLIEDGHVSAGNRYLVRPPELRFNAMNILIHGITEEDVVGAPDFATHWKEGLKDLLDESLLLAPLRVL